MSTTVTGGLSPVRQVLPGGAVVLVQETAFSPAVTVNVAFRAGSLYEPAPLCGLSWQPLLPQPSGSDAGRLNTLLGWHFAHATSLWLP